MNGNLSIATAPHKPRLPPAEAFAQGNQLMLKAHWQEAAALWKSFRDCYAGHPAPWLQGAETHMALGDKGTAGDLLREARSLFPSHLRTWLASIEWAMKAGSPEQVDAFVQELMDREVDRSNALVAIAEVAERAGDVQRACACWQDLHQMSPDAPMALERLAKLHRRLGNASEARRYRLLAEYGALPSTPLRTAEKQPILHFMQLVLVRALLNLKSESSRTHLNLAWVVVEPLLHLLVYYFLFGNLLHAGRDGYGTFLLTGLLPWMWFAKAITASSNSILAGQTLLLNTGISPAFFPLVGILQASLKQLPAFALLLLLLLSTGHIPSGSGLLMLPLLLALQMLFTCAVGLLVAAIIPFARDLANLVGTGLTLLMFLSGVVYDPRTLSGRFADIVTCNPLLHLIALYRQALLENDRLDLPGVLYLLITATLLLCASWFIFTRYRDRFARRGME